MEKLELAARQMEEGDSPNFMPQLQPSAVVQSIKLVVKLLGGVETLDITEALDSLKDVCHRFISQSSQVRKCLERHVIDDCFRIWMPYKGSP